MKTATFNQKLNEQIENSRKYKNHKKYCCNLSSDSDVLLCVLRSFQGFALWTSRPLWKDEWQEGSDNFTSFIKYLINKITHPNTGE